MWRTISLATLIVAGLCGVAPSAHARSETLMDLLGNRDSASCPRYQRTPQDACNIVVHRPGGNPTQDMTGSIGHAKSWQANGGPRCKTICRFTGTQY
ncbi:hypothetical protein GOFOIKOB_6114 [Methylobacterium tardum]|jgi:hypothetical protein|uniref:Uncharacterized protein n=1 Tax=Methylobacterium tardum TaxID=374432 RepID=A0AA37WTD1_9HYPH|nr:hypothetical protein [Methylobacterium tardum]URD36012.1 hypothetical protein M6G65_26820 [Methylobacterium tardum]GJE53039.1 hypothetical protein GOFOIKOB_6114 [Methylobacterium tardum]GLS72101.1 hypothetical protein GCM10007890_41140 [Methylobacterium tardum]